MRLIKDNPGAGRRYRAPSPLLASMLAGVITLGLAILFSQPAQAGAGECAVPAGARNATINLREQDGRAEINLMREGSPGRKFRIEYNDEMYVGKFDADSKASLSFALTAPRNEIVLRLAESPAITCTLDVTDFAKLYRVILRWRDPVRLDLDVVEPGRQPGGPGHLNRERTNADLAQGMGRIDIVTDSAEDGATAELSYVVANGPAMAGAGTPILRMEYLSRGIKAEPPFCGDHPRAAIPFELYVINRGTVKRSQFSTARVRCGESLTDAARLMRLRQ